MLPKGAWFVARVGKRALMYRLSMLLLRLLLKLLLDLLALLAERAPPAQRRCKLISLGSRSRCGRRPFLRRCLLLRLCRLLFGGLRYRSIPLDLGGLLRALLLRGLILGRAEAGLTKRHFLARRLFVVDLLSITLLYGTYERWCVSASE